MKIVDLRATPVTVPAEAPWRWSMGIETGTTRTVIELITDEGIVGLGETYGGARTVEALEIAKPFIVGLDPLETGLLQHRLGVFCIGYEMSVPPLVRAVIEMACLDAAGKALGRSVASLLGGAVRDGVDVASYLFYRYPSEDGRLPGGRQRRGDPRSSGRARRAQRPPSPQAQGRRPAARSRSTARCKLLRDRFPDDPLVWDPNAAWSVETTIRVGRRLTADAFELQWLEDPCNWLEGMSQARAATGIPFATNMCLIGPDQLAPGIRARSVDVILADVHYWGGFRANQKMAAVVEAFNLGLGHAQRPRARDLDRGDGPAGLRDPEPDLRRSTATTTTRPTTSSPSRGSIATAGSSCRPARASASSSIATSSTSTIATSSTTSRSTSSTTRIGRAGCPPCRSSDDRSLGDVGADPAGHAQPALLPAGRSLEGAPAAGRGAAPRPRPGRHRAPGGQPVDRPGPRAGGRGRSGRSTTRSSGRPRRSATATRAIGTASSCSSAARPARSLFHETRRLTHLRVVQAIGLRLPDGTTLTVANTHLHHPDGPPGYVARLRQARTILAFLDGLPATDATVLGGDLNGLPDEPSPDLPVRRRLPVRDARGRDRRPGDVRERSRRADDLPRAELLHRLPARPRVGPRRRRPALAFDRPAADDPGLYPSDHLGLVADLEISSG